jgi:hypothetical protein
MTMRTPALIVLLVALSWPATAQIPCFDNPSLTCTTFGVQGSGLAGSSFFMQLTFAAGIPAIPALVVSVTLPFDVGANGVALTVANAINAGFQGQKAVYAGFSAKTVVGPKGTTTHYGLVEVRGPRAVSLGIDPTGPGISFNPLTQSGVATNPCLYDFLGPLGAPGVFFAAAPPSTGSPNATMSINGQEPNSNILHRIELPDPGLLSFEMQSGANAQAGIALLMSPTFRPGWLPLPGGAGIDLADVGSAVFPFGIVLLADGIGFTVNPALDAFFHTNTSALFTLAISVSIGAPANAAFQALILDPSAPIGLAATQAADVVFASGRDVLAATGSDGAVFVPFTPGKTFTFYGVSYTGAFAHANGLVTFGAPSSVVTSGLAIDPVALGLAEPAICVHAGDWDPTAPGGPGGVLVSEFDDRVKISWGSAAAPIAHAFVSDAAIFECQLRLGAFAPPPLFPAPCPYPGISGDADGGTVVLDYQLLDGGGGPIGAFDTVVGITPGGGLDPAPVSRDLGAPLAGLAPLRSILSQHDASGAAASNLSFAGAGVPPVFNDGATLAGRSLSFQALAQMGGQSYSFVPSSPRAPAFTGAATQVATISANAGGILSLVGYFRELYVSSPAPGTLAGSVHLDPLVSNLNLPIAGITNNQGFSSSLPVPPGYAEFEGLDVQVPPLGPAFVGATVTSDVQITFADGSTRTRPVTIMFVP